MGAIIKGVTYFEEIIIYFKKHYKVLSPWFIDSKNLPSELQKEEEVLKMHDAFIGELKVGFSAALSKDRMIIDHVGLSMINKFGWLVFRSITS
jgi:hypothetical protein